MLNLPVDDPQILSCDFFQCGQLDRNFNTHVHRKTCPYTIWAQALEGSYEISCGDGRHEKLSPGNAFLTAANIALEITHHGNPRNAYRMRSRWLHIHITIFGTIDLMSLLDLPLSVNNRQCEVFGDIFQRFSALDTSTNPLQNLAVRQRLAFETLEQLLGISDISDAGKYLLNNLDRLADVLKFMRENISARVSVADLARLAHMSEPHFHALFKQLIGQSPMKYFKSIRLSAACKMILAGEMSLEQIAASCWFCNEFHLSRDFRRHYGSSPVKYRKTCNINLA